MEMDWLGAGIGGPLVVIRAIHFSATAILAGSLIFRAVVAKPALRSEPAIAKLFRTQIRTQTLGVAWIGLSITTASGVIWFLLQAVAMSGRPFGEAMTSDVLLTVLNQTQFGLVSEIRFALAIILAACLAYDRLAQADWFALVAALGLTAAIAWNGHAGATPGAMGNVHVTVDVLHLIAAAAWIGGLVSLALLLVAARNIRTAVWVPLARNAAERFSTLGIISVTTLMVTGIVNAWILVGSFHALVMSGYGRLLMLKIAIFAIMLVFAAANRFWLTPRLGFSSANEAQFEALRQLTRNSVIEIALGITIFAIVGMLGTLHPTIHGL